MAVVSLPARPTAVDIAGSAWPTYKLEAIALALASCLLLTLITGSLQVAVLTAAVFGTTRWIIGQAARHKHPHAPFQDQVAAMAASPRGAAPSVPPDLDRGA